MPTRPHLSIPTPGSRRAVVVGAGSFGTATAVLLARGGFRTTLQRRTPEQCPRLEGDRENREYLSEVALPRDLRIEPMSAGLGRGELPLDAWVAQVRATVPPPARFDGGAAWRRAWWQVGTRLRRRP